MSFGLWVLWWAETAQNQPGQSHWSPIRDVPSISNQEPWLNWERTLTALFSSRFPFYYELKIAFVAWLLSPYTKGSSLLYRKFVHPTLSSKEKVIKGAQVLLGWKQSAVCLLHLHITHFHWRTGSCWFSSSVIWFSFWSVFLSFAVFFINTGIYSARSHAFVHLRALEKLGGRGMKTPPELLCTY